MGVDLYNFWDRTKQALSVEVLVNVKNPCVGDCMAARKLWSLCVSVVHGTHHKRAVSTMVAASRAVIMVMDKRRETKSTKRMVRVLWLPLLGDQCAPACFPSARTSYKATLTQPYSSGRISVLRGLYSPSLVSSFLCECHLEWLPTGNSPLKIHGNNPLNAYNTFVVGMLYTYVIAVIFFYLK